MSKKKKYIIIIIAFILCIGGFVGGKLYLDAKERVAAYQSMQDKLVCILSDEERVIELGTKYTYTDSEDAELSKFPDQLKPFIQSIPKDSHISIENTEREFNKPGEEEETIIIKMTNSKGDEVVNNQTIKFEVKDTKDPDVTLKAEKVDKATADLIKANVVGVVDPIFGEYPFDDSGKERTYKIDTSKVDFSKPGEYTVYLIINDNGRIIEKEFKAQI